MYFSLPSDLKLAKKKKFLFPKPCYADSLNKTGDEWWEARLGGETGRGKRMDCKIIIIIIITAIIKNSHFYLFWLSA